MFFVKRSFRPWNSAIPWTKRHHFVTYTVFEFISILFMIYKEVWANEENLPPLCIFYPLSLNSIPRSSKQQHWWMKDINIQDDLKHSSCFKNLTGKVCLTKHRCHGDTKVPRSGQPIKWSIFSSIISVATVHRAQPEPKKKHFRIKILTISGLIIHIAWYLCIFS